MGGSAEGYQSWTKFDKEIVKLKQLYDYTCHLYLQDLENLRQRRREKKRSFQTVIGSTSHSVNALYDYAKSHYPRRLRQLVLIAAVCALETLLTRLISEIYRRTLEPFKVQDQIEISRAELLNSRNIDAIGLSQIRRDARKITGGGFEVAVKYYKKMFDVDFGSLGVSIAELREIYDRRHLIVHANSIVDQHYYRTYHKGKVGQPLDMSHEYLIGALSTVRGFGVGLRRKLMEIYPVCFRNREQFSGMVSLSVDNVFMIELHILDEAFNFDAFIKDTILAKTENGSITIWDVLIKAVRLERTIKIFIHGELEIIRRIFPLLRGNAAFQVIEILQIA
jgi:hypothetical protein